MSSFHNPNYSHSSCIFQLRVIRMKITFQSAFMSATRVTSEHSSKPYRLQTKPYKSFFSCVDGAMVVPMFPKRIAYFSVNPSDFQCCYFTFGVESTRHVTTYQNPIT